MTAWRWRRSSSRLHKPGAVSICLSSQVGCVMGCQFCATARMPHGGTWRTWEIVDQFIQARDLAKASGRRVTGAVFMGMGEPFLNYDQVLDAATDPALPVGWLGRGQGHHHQHGRAGAARSTDSRTRATSTGSPSVWGPRPTPSGQRLVPLAARTPVAEVMAAARRHALTRRDRVTLAYVCIAGENMGEDDARALGELIGDTPVRVDLIEVTDPTGRFQPPSLDELRAFRDALSRHVGQPIVRRYSGGKDILAACGTLAGESVVELHREAGSRLVVRAITRDASESRRLRSWRRAEISSSIALRKGRRGA